MSVVRAYEDVFRVLVYGPISGIELAPSVSPGVIGIASHFNYAFALNALQKMMVGFASEIDVARSPNLVVMQPGIAQTLDTAFALDRKQIKAVGLATSSNLALALASPGGTSDSSLTPPVIDPGVGQLSYPPAIDFYFMDANIKAGDVLAVRKSATFPVPQGATKARVTLTDGMITSGQITFATQSDAPTFLSSISSPAQTFFEAYIERGALYGPDSNTIKHGDATAPDIVTSSPTSANEGSLVLTTLTFDEPVTAVSFTGLDGALLKAQPNPASTDITVILVSGALTDYESKPSYSYTINVIDLAGNAASFPMVSNLVDVSENPTQFTFTDVMDATVDTQYTSNTITISGLPGGVNAPFTTTGEYRKNGGAWTPAGSGTVANTDTIQFRLTSGSTPGSSVGATLTVGTTSDTYTVAVPGQKYRYARLRIDDTNDGSNYAAMAALEVSSAPGTADLSGTATKSASSSAFGTVVGNLFDGNASTYWHSNNAGFPQWILLDWGTNSANWEAIGAARLKERAGGEWYQMPTIGVIEQSDDLTTWVTKFDVNDSWSGAPGGTTREYS